MNEKANMANTISGTKPFVSEHNVLAGNPSLGCAAIADHMVSNAVDAILSRLATAYLDLIGEANKNPEIISDYKSNLLGYYANKDLTFEAKIEMIEAKKMARDDHVVTKILSSGDKISVFSEKNKGFYENQPLSKARVYVRLSVEALSIKEEDPLDLLLSQLSKKILSLGYGDEGTFDIRLEKGCLPLEGSAWKWHFDGEILKTSITVCYSNKENWSTRIPSSEPGSDGKPADHGFLYDALNVKHRAPIPSDLDCELNNNDYRLFIRYKEYHTKASESGTPPSKAKAEERRTPKILNKPFTESVSVEEKIPALLSNIKTSAVCAGVDSFINKNSLKQFENLLVDPTVLENIRFKYPDSPKYDLSKIMIPLATEVEIGSKESVFLSPFQFNNNHFIQIDTKGNEQLLIQPVEELPPGPVKAMNPCILM